METSPETISSNFQTVAVAILNYNGLLHLQRFLPTLLELEYPAANFYLVDNNSSDGSVEWVQSSFQNVSIIQHGINLGFAEGYNRALQQLQEEYILIINSDVAVKPDFLEHLVARMNSSSKIAAVQPKILSLSNPEYFEHAGAAGGMIDTLGYAFCRGRLFDSVEKDAGQYNTPAQVFWASGACSLYRRSAWQQVGGMYAWFFMHFEEIDLCWRLQANGFEIWYEPDAVIHHLGGGSLSYSSPRKTYFNFRNNLVMVLRNAETLFLLWWLPARIMLDFFAALMFLLKGNGTHAASVFKAWWHAIKWAGDNNDSKPAHLMSLSKLSSVFKGSVLWQYFVLGKKTV